MKEQISNQPSKKIEIWQPLLFSVVLALGMLIGFYMDGNHKGYGLIEKVTGLESVSPGRVEEIIRFIDSRYVDKIDDDSLVEVAIQSLFKKLDPHSLYISPERIKQLNDQMNGSYEGLGIETILYQDSLIITHVLKNSPASAAGLSTYDIILGVNDSITSGVESKFERIRNQLRGSTGDTVTLTLQLNSSRETVSKQLVISDVPLRASDIAYMVNDSIGYIKIKRFNSNVYREFMESLERLAGNPDFKHLVIDVRNNPGGYLPETTKILSQLFKQKGRLLVYTEGKNDRLAEYKSTGKTFFDVQKIAVLTDEGSASGSEILAGAIQDWDRGVIIGRRTFGKGLVQEQFALRNGGAIRLTVARYFTPSGRLIQRPYNDMYMYRHEMQNRWNNGELQDEENISFEDSITYYTKVLKRKVYGGGGIMPDIFVPLDTLLYSTEYKFLFSKIPSFLYYYIKSVNGDFPADEKQYFNSPVSEESLYDSYLEFNKNERTPFYSEFLNSNKEKFLELLHYGLIDQLYGEISAEKWMKEKDQFILEAVKSMSDGSWLVENR